MVERLFYADGKRVGFAGCETAEVDAVIRATGYKDESRWVAVPEVKDPRGGFVHWPGVSPAPGLYFIGRSWQWTRGSALLAGVSDDASYVVSRIAERLSGKMPAEDDRASRDVTTAVAMEKIFEQPTRAVSLVSSWEYALPKMRPVGNEKYTF